jgi:CubicO group peptidase (beta-lactamase class C family)
MHHESGHTLRLLVVLLLLSTGFPAAALDQDRLDTWRAEAGVPGIAVLTFDRDGIRTALHAGERSAGSGVAVGDDDLWHLGSNAKAMTATLVEALLQRGQIERELSVAQALGEQLDAIDPAWNEVGFDQLLSHCSGLPANLGRLRTLALIGTDGNRNASADRLDYAAALLSQPPEHPPGSRFEYSNAGYVIVGAMLETRTGEPFFDLLNQHVFLPLGIKSAGIGPPGSAETLDQPRGHRDGLLGALKAVPPGAAADNPPALTPAGRIHMTLEDYARFLIDLARGLNGQGTLLPDASYKRLTAPGCSETYALGWGRDKAGRLTHAGSNTMWLVRTWLEPETGRGLIIASNDGRIEAQDELFQRIRNELLPD